MTQHKIVSEADWIEARKKVLAEEKALAKARERIAALRRDLPWVKIEKKYEFDTASGKKSLADLFEGRGQLFVQHFMFAPEWEAGCPGCSFAADHIDAAWQHLKHHDVTFVAVSRAPLAKLQGYKKRMGWRFNWVSSQGSDFNYDFHVSFTGEQLAKGKVFHNFEMIENNNMEDLPGGSVFYKDADGSIYLTYADYGDGSAEVLGTYMILDLMPNGRNETGPMAWVKRHDEYEGERRKAG
ncbi:MAG TPA: thioredoxin family protein [Dongiaceae bacterium]|nr:thioredoxin family protein [Dongiaceae bacterium]